MVVPFPRKVYIIIVSVAAMWCPTHFQQNISINLSIKTGSGWRDMATNTLWIINFYIILSFRKYLLG